MESKAAAIPVLIIIILLSLLTAAAHAQTAAFSVLAPFSPDTDGLQPETALILGSDGNLYGTTSGGGAYGFGTVFRLATGGMFTILYNFAGSDGSNPGPLIQGTDGDFYDVTASGGANGSGTVFKITTAGVLTTLYSFSAASGGDNSDGRGPLGGVVQGTDGNFYGTAEFGGANGTGTIFKITPGGSLTPLHSFGATTNEENADGAYPASDLIQGTDGNFYGTAFSGGVNGDGTVFQVTPAGVFTTLHSFAGSTDGSVPVAGLLKGNDGYYYGTTLQGGSGGQGVVFKLTSATDFSLVASLASGGCRASLIQDSASNLYGTTAGAIGSPQDGGLIFKITPGGTLSTLHTFAGADYGSANAGGANPDAQLTQANGNFYGTASAGGSGTYGTIFDITPDGVFHTLHSFTKTNLTGAAPEEGLILGSDGNFYGTAPAAGPESGGTLYRITPGGTFSTLYYFSLDTTSAGSKPRGLLLEDGSGDFYGTDTFGGIYNGGTAFEISSSGVLTTLASFNSVSNPGGLILGSGGNLFGTTASGNGQDGDGTVYEITSSGNYSVLDYFNSGTGGGFDPSGHLILAGDGYLYGTTTEGGTFSQGTVFKVDSTGALTTIYNFGQASTDGSSPNGGLVEGSDGYFYGTTGAGGANKTGTFFKINATGVLTTLYNFSAEQSIDDVDVNSDGAAPEATLIEGSDGNFYGTTLFDGTNGTGTVFQVTPGGLLTNLHSFAALSSGNPSNSGINSDGGNAFSSLLEYGDGTFYGTASAGGVYGNGTVFKLTVSPAITSPSSARGIVGQKFSYAITATNTPTGYGAPGLPAGLTADPTTGVISGTPTAAGSFPVALSASNAGGTGTETLNLTILPQPPVITSATSENGKAGQAFSYQISASNQPTSYGASGLPSGLSINGSTGLISGSPTQNGTFSVALRASNAGGSGTATLTLTIAVGAPAITSATYASGTVGKAFSYQIAASNQPTSFGETGLPSGLSINGSTGLISGTPSKAGTSSVTLRASNAGGSGVATLTLTIAEAVPVITSSTSASGQVGQAFSYQIAATNAPTSFGASNLPSGLTASAGGLVSGTPTKAGTYSIGLRASNAGGSGTATLTLTVAAGAPAITSATTASGTVGKAFSYQITASNQPTSFGETGLPGGLSINGSTGLISGTPSKAGTSSVTLRASNAGGSGVATLTLTVASAGS